MFCTTSLAIILCKDLEPEKDSGELTTVGKMLWSVATLEPIISLALLAIGILGTQDMIPGLSSHVAYSLITFGSLNLFIGSVIMVVYKKISS